MRKHTWQENLISALIGIAIGLPLALYAGDEQEKTRARDAEIRQEILREQSVSEAQPLTLVIKTLNEEPKETPQPLFTISEEEFELMAQIVCAETYADDMEGKQYVADVILNRVDDPRFEDSITEVIFAPGQFSTASKVGEIEPALLDYGAVISELNDRKNTEIIYFTCTGYIGTPCFECGGELFREVRGRMIEHKVKISPKWFEDVKSGLKNFEIRKNDRDYQIGDYITLREWDRGKYTGRQITRKIQYIYQGDGTYGLSDEYCILGLAMEEEE